MSVWQILVLVFLAWIAFRMKPSLGGRQAVTGWKYSFVNVSDKQIHDIPDRLNESGRWGRELIMLWSPPQPSSDQETLYAIMRERVPLGQREDA
jgi:hypothetical protein